MSAGKLFISAVMAEGSVSGFLKHGKIGDLFRPSEKELYDFVKNFVGKHGALPKPETIEAHIGEVVGAAKEPASYYLELMTRRHTELTLKKAMSEADQFLSTAQKDPEKALTLMTTAVMELAASKHQTQMIDFRHAYDLLIPAYAAKYNAEDGTGLYYGWPTLDEMTGGVRQGDMVSEVGRPGMGKTYKLLYGAHHGWANTGAYIAAMESAAGSDMGAQKLPGVSRLFISMEMAVEPIAERLAAMHTHLPVSQVDKAELSTKGLIKLKDGLTEIKGYAAPFWIVDGNLTSTVEDIWMLARQLKPDAIFLDGGYLVKHPTERDRYRRVAENADLMKQELAPLAPTTVSWQFAKTASNKKKGEAVTGDDVGYTDAIYQVSSVMTGLFQPDSVETIHQRVNRILKGRKGEIGEFITNWDFVKMDFSEITNVDVGDLQFI